MATFYRRWFKVGVGAAVSVTSILLLFTFLVSYYGFEITGTDDMCAGTLDDPCISYVNITNPTRYNVDMYNQNEVELVFSPSVPDYKLFRKDGRCSGKDGSACCSPDGVCLKGWKFTDFTPATRPLADKVYVQRFTAYSTTEFLVWGLKENPTDRVKWDFSIDSKGLNNGYLDPLWGYEDVVDDSLVLRLKFDKNALDSSGNGNDGTNYGAVNISGKINGAYDFDGINDYVSIASVNTGDEVTVSAWVTAGSSFGTVVDNQVAGASNAGIQLFKTAANFTACKMDDGVGTQIQTIGTIQIADGDWHFIACTKDASDALTVYVDGEVDTIGGSPVGDISSSDTLYIGKDLTPQYWNGSIDELRIYNKSLSIEEIKTLYEWRPDSLVAHWKFNGNGLDSKGSNDAIINGASIVPGKYDLGYDFDGVDDYIRSYDSNNDLQISTHDFSYGAWVNPKKFAGGVNNIIARYSAYPIYHISMSTTGVLTRLSYNTTAGYNYMLEYSHHMDLDEWYHVFVTINRDSNMTMFLNGVQVNTVDISNMDGLNLSTDNLFMVGAACTGTCNFWTGIIDEVRFYNRSLEASEILELYNETKTSHSNKIYGSPEEAQLTEVLGDELLSDSDMEAVGVGNWTDIRGDVTKETTNPHSGSRLIRLNATNTSAFFTTVADTTVVGKTYRLTGWTRSDGTSVPNFYDGTGIKWAGNTSTDWQYIDVVYTAGFTKPRFYTGTGIGYYAEFDDLSIKEVTSPDVTGNLVSEWKFNGNALDSKGSNDGTVDGASIVPGKFGLGYDFDGDNDYISMSTIEGTGILTISLWVKLDDMVSNGIIDISTNSNDYLKVGTWNEKILVSAYGTNANSKETSSLATGIWYHIVITKTTGNITNIYTNGIDDTNAGTTNFGYSEQRNIGNVNDGGAVDWYLDGLIDEVRVYNTSLNAAQVRRLYNETKTTHSRKIYGSGEETQLLQVLGEELLIDGDMEAVGVATWLSTDGATLTKETGTRTGGNGVQVLRCQDNNSNNFASAYQASLTIGKTYRATGWGRSDGNTIPRFYDGADILVSGTTSTDWQYLDVTFTTTTTALKLVSTNSANGYVEFDDITVKEVTSLDVTDDLISHYKMNGNALDSKGNNDATVNGASITPGKSGLGYYFDGVDDVIDAGTGFRTLQNVSMSGWFKIISVATTSYDWILLNFESSSNQWGVLVQDDGSGLDVILYDDIFNGNHVYYRTPINFNEWNHVVSVFNDNGNQTHENILYVNGVNVGSGSICDGVWNNITGNIHIGAEASMFAQSNSIMDEVRIYNTTLNDAQVRRLYNETKTTHSRKIYGSPETI